MILTGILTSVTLRNWSLWGYAVLVQNVLELCSVNHALSISKGNILFWLSVIFYDFLPPNCTSKREINVL